MDGKELREQIIEAEWKMFQATHNKGGRASCQDDYMTFYNMRRAQFDAWNEETAESYLEDLEMAENCGRNLIAEKYLNMMKHTHPEEYEAQKHFLPDVSEEKQRLSDEICSEMIAQTIPLREDFPHVGDSGRPLFSEEDNKGFISVQTYQMGELLTYSERTLYLLRDHLFSLKKMGKSLAREVTSRSICSYGFASLEEAEAFLSAKQKQGEYKKQ